MAADTDGVARALAATLSNVASERHAAETTLKQLASHNTHAAHLLTLAVSADTNVASAAAIRLKNLLRIRQENSFPDDARAPVRQHILQALSAVRATNVEGLLAETTRRLVLLDFPCKWPQLLPTISNYLASRDPPRVHAALVALRQLVKCYEFKTRDPKKLYRQHANEANLSYPRQPLDDIAEACFPILLALYSSLDEIVEKSTDLNGERENACNAQRLIVKIFWSCTQFILPPCLAAPDMLDQWMTCFFRTIVRPCKHPYVDDPTEIGYQPEWKTKKWIAQVLSRFLKRYGTPKKVPIDEPWAKTVAEVFKEKHSAEATRIMLQVVSAETRGEQLSRRVANLALDFIEEALETAALWSVIRPHVDTLLTGVVFRYLCFCSIDEEEWVTDPGEYIRKQYEFTDDFTSPRTAASNLLLKMADLRSKSTILPFLSYLMTNVLEPFKNACIGTPQRAELARQKVGAFRALSAVRGKLKSKEDLSSSFLNVLKVHVEPDLRCEFGFVRSEAACLLGSVASCEWPEFSASLGEASLRGCVSLLQDSEVTVQGSAAGALQFLLDQKGAKELIKPVAIQLLEKLLQLVDEMRDGYLSLLPAIEKLIAQYSDEVLVHAVPITRKLITAFNETADSILRDGDDADDEHALAGGKVLQVVSNLLKSVGEWDEKDVNEKVIIFRSLEAELQSLLSNMFNRTHQVFIEELLDVLSVQVMQTGELNGGLSPFLLSLIPKMYQGFEEWAEDYVKAMSQTIEGYLTFDLPGIIRMDGGLACFVNMTHALWSSKFEDDDAAFGAKIAETLILQMNKLKPISSPLIDVIIDIARRAAERCMKVVDDECQAQQRLFSVVMLCIYMDAEKVIKSLGAHSVSQLIESQTNDLSVFTRIHSKKALILAICEILCTRGLVSEEAKPNLLNLALRLEQMIQQQRAESVQHAANSANDLTKTNGFSPFVSLQDDGSDLEDDQDALNFLDELHDSQNGDLGRLVAETGIRLETLEHLHTNGGVLVSGGLFDFSDFDDDDDDEGTFSGHALDDINEVSYLIMKVKESSVDSWWSKVNMEDKVTMERLVKEQGSNQ